MQKTFFYSCLLLFKMKKYNLDIIRFITLFESVTKTNVKDCFFWNEILVFIVKEGQGRKAVGSQGKNVKRISNMLNKRIKVVEYNEDAVSFIKGFVSPIIVEGIRIDDNIMTVKVNSTKDKGLLIGRESKNLNMLKEVVKKYFKVDNVKID